MVPGRSNCSDSLSVLQMPTMHIFPWTRSVPPGLTQLSPVHTMREEGVVASQVLGLPSRVFGAGLGHPARWLHCIPSHAAGPGLPSLGHRGACEPCRVACVGSVHGFGLLRVFVLAQWSSVLSLFCLAEEGTVLEVEGI